MRTDLIKKKLLDWLTTAIGLTFEDIRFMYAIFLFIKNLQVLKNEYNVTMKMSTVFIRFDQCFTAQVTSTYSLLYTVHLYVTIYNWLAH
jgi:hypothetical protein